MSGQTSYDSSGASGAVNDMGDSVDAIRAKIKAVTDLVDSARSGWVGDANQAFNSAASNWDDEANKLNGILDQFTQEVGHGNKQFTGLEGDNTQMFQKLTSL